MSSVYSELDAESDLRAFDAEFYVARYPDVSGSGMGPIEHFRTIGRLLGRQPAASIAADSVRPASAGGPRASMTAEGGSRVKVSVLCVTYNHENYIRQAIESFLMQDVDFDVEFIIGDDCSTDATPRIIRELAATDSRIVPVLREKNVGSGVNFTALTYLARGDYVALCDGDDYWTDPDKLKRQVDFLDRNPEYSVCFHPVHVRHEDGQYPDYVFPESCPPTPPLSRLVRDNFIQTNSVMYRWRFRGGMPGDYDTEVRPLDWHLHLLHAEIGKIGYLDRVMSVYRRHSGGMWATSFNPEEHRRTHGKGELTFYRDLRSRFGGFYEEMLFKTSKAIMMELIADGLIRDDFDAIVSHARVDPRAARNVLLRFGLPADAVDLSSPRQLRENLSRRCKVSVIVLSYNHAATIEQCLNSVLGQIGFFSLEIIVGDDRSSDGTPEVVRRIAAAHPGKIKIIENSKNIGMVPNLKQTIAQCTGDFIAFCEADDYWLSDRKLIKQLISLAHNPKAPMCFNWLLLEFPERGTFIPHPEQAALQGNIVPFSHLAREPVTANFSCCLYRAEAVASIPAEYYEVSWAADWLFNLYVIRNGHAIFNRELMSVYRVHESGQWSGLPAAERQRRVKRSRDFCRSVFGEAHGFDDSSVEISVTLRRGASVERFRFEVDSPASGARLTLQSHSFAMSGWLVDLLGDEPELVVSFGDTKLMFPMEIDRRDVTTGIARDYGESWYRLDRCGFQVQVPFTGRECQYNLGIRVSGEIFWIGSMAARLVCAPDKLNLSS